MVVVYASVNENVDGSVVVALILDDNAAIGKQKSSQCAFQNLNDVPDQNESVKNR